MIIYGPSLAELFIEAGLEERIAAVDRFTILPAGLDDITVAGDMFSPSLEMISSLEATSIHLVGSNQSLVNMARDLGIPCYTYSFDTLEDVFRSCEEIESRYQEADLGDFISSIESRLDQGVPAEDGNVSVMVVIYFQEDGAITLAGKGTYFQDIVSGLGYEFVSPEQGTYPMVSVEGVIEMSPDRIIILAPGEEPEAVLDRWTGHGLDTCAVSVLTGDRVLIPGAGLPELISLMDECVK